MLIVLGAVGNLFFIAPNYRIGGRFNAAYTLLSIYLLTFAKNTSESMC